MEPALQCTQCTQFNHEVTLQSQYLRCAAGAELPGAAREAFSDLMLFASHHRPCPQRMPVDHLPDSYRAVDLVRDEEVEARVWEAALVDGIRRGLQLERAQLSLKPSKDRKAAASAPLADMARQLRG